MEGKENKIIGKKITSNMKEVYYKYIPLTHLERFVDILMHQHLYGATYLELNDPMEGRFDKSKLSTAQLNILYDNLHNTRICSLCKSEEDIPTDYLMWSHYADGHRGCCLKIELTGSHNSEWGLVDVNYTSTTPSISPESPIVDQVKEVISAKHTLWTTECETRAVRVYSSKNKLQTQSKFLNIKIKAIYLGCKVAKENKKFYVKLIQAICKDKIDLYKMSLDKSSATLSCQKI